MFLEIDSPLLSNFRRTLLWPGYEPGGGQAELWKRIDGTKLGWSHQPRFLGAISGCLCL